MVAQYLFNPNKLDFFSLGRILPLMYRATVMILVYFWAAVIGTAAPNLVSVQLTVCDGECMDVAFFGAASLSQDRCCSPTEGPIPLRPCCYETAPDLPDHALTALPSASQPGFVAVSVRAVQHLDVSALGFSATSLALLPAECAPPSPRAGLIRRQVWRL